MIKFKPYGLFLINWGLIFWSFLGQNLSTKYLLYLEFPIIDLAKWRNQNIFGWSKIILVSLFYNFLSSRSAGDRQTPSSTRISTKVSRRKQLCNYVKWTWLLRMFRYTIVLSTITSDTVPFLKNVIFPIFLFFIKMRKRCWASL